MRKLALIIVLLFSSPVWADISVLQSGPSTTSTTLGPTTAGAGFLLVTDETTAPTSCTITGGDSLTKKISLPSKVAGLTLTVWYDKNEGSGSHTAFSCSGGSGLNAYHWVEVSGQDTTTFIDKVVPCFFSSSTICNPNAAGNYLTISPGYSSGMAFFAATCAGSATTVSGSPSGVTWTFSVADGGNPGAYTIFSSAGAITASPTGCGGTNAVILDIKAASGATQACTWDLGYYNNGTQTTSGTNTVTATILQPNDLILTAGFVQNSTTSLTVNINSVDNLTQSNIGTSSSDTGQTFLDYMLNNTQSGASASINFVISGSYTSAQFGYAEFIPSANCTMAHDQDSTVGTGSGATANTPSITATTGALEWIYTSTGSGVHVSSVASPWSCNYFTATSDCTYVSSRSAFGYVLSASGSSTANNMPLTTGTWQAIASSFKLTPNASAVINPPHSSIM